MTITTRSAEANRPRRAFTLAEVMVASSLAAVLIGGVLATAVMIGVSGMNAEAYGELDAQMRAAMDTFARDAREAVAIHWNSDQNVTLTVPTPAGAMQGVTYVYDADELSPTRGCFVRLAFPAPPRVLVRGVAADFAFRRYKLDTGGAPDSAAANDLETRQIQVSLRASRTALTATASQTALSARFVLRNKGVDR